MRLAPAFARRVLATAVLGLVFAAALARATERGTTRPPPAGVPSIEATPVAGEAAAVKLDGVLDEDVWARAPSVSGFLQREPSEGAPATFDTDVRVAYNATHVFVAVLAHDPDPARIVGLLTRRDTESPSDWIRVFIDSYHDRRSAYEFAVNPVGVKLDTYWFNDNQSDPGWDAVWDVAVTRTAGGWEAEFSIPLSQLRFQPQSDARFGFAVARTVARLNETSSWPLVAKSANGIVSSFGDLTGLTVTQSPRRLELLPYVVSTLQTNPNQPGNPLVHSPDPGVTAGLDLKYAIGPGLTLTGTVNPDFGQVEADPAVVNLSAFETFFPERRPFFLEGSGIFRFDIDCEDESCSGLFYSRRIGREPQGEPDVPSDGYVTEPSQTTIVGAAKLTGRVGTYAIGGLAAVTAEERAQVATADGTGLPDQPVEPWTTYTVLRARREFANQSAIGFMGTAVNRSLSGSLQNTLASQAYTGGVDVDWRLSKRYRVSGFVAGSDVFGDAAAMTALQENNRHLFQRPDADYLQVDPSATSIAGHAGQVMFSKIAGERTRFNSSYAYRSPGFEINDAGFMRRADEKQIVNWFQVRHDRPTRLSRSWRLNFNEWMGWNFGGDRLFNGGNVNGHVVFTNNWRTGVGVNVNGQAFDDRATRGGPGAYRNPRLGSWQYLETDDRHALAFDVFDFYGQDRYGSWNFEIAPGVQYRPTSALLFRVGGRWSRNVDDSQWIENLEGPTGETHVFGHLDQRTLGLTFRVNYTLAPRLSLQLYAEPFVSVGAYSGFKQLVDGRAQNYDQRYAPIVYDANPDFRYTSFRTTNVLRWEYRRGSTLFVVWQQDREGLADDGTFQFGSDLGEVFAPPGRNVFLVKVAYWLNP